MSAVDDALNHFRGQVIDAIADAAPALVDAAQADVQAQVTDLTTQLAAATQQIGSLQQQATQDAATIKADGESMARLEAQHSSDTATIGDLQRRIAELEAQVPAPDAPAMLVGSTYPGKSLADWDILHYYIQPNGSVPDDADVLTYTGYLGGVGWSTNSANVAKVKAHLAKLADRPGMYVNDFHEPEDNYGRTTAGAAKYAADATVFGQLVAAANAARTNPLEWFQQFQGGSLVGQNDPEKMKAWVVDSADLVAFDVYGPNQVDASIAFAASVDKPLAVGEMGGLDNVPKTDAAMLAYAQAAFPKFKAAKVRFVTWFNKTTAGAYLGQYPDTLAYILTQRAA